MNWALIFALVNGFALIAWLILILAPRPGWIIPAFRIGIVGSLCLFYAALFAYALWHGFGLGDAPAPDFTTIAGVRWIFSSDGGVLIGWTHYLAFDLFVGLWIAEDATRRGVGRVGQAPILALTYLVGPVGLLVYLLLVHGVWRRSAG